MNRQIADKLAGRQIAYIITHTLFHPRGVDLCVSPGLVEFTHEGKNNEQKRTAKFLSYTSVRLVGGTEPFVNPCEACV